MKKKLLIPLILIVAAAAAALGYRYYIRDEAKNEVNLNMYYLSSKQSTLIAEEQTVKYDENDDITQIVLENLIKGNSKNSGIADKKTTVNSVTKGESGVIADFSKDFLTNDSMTNTFAAYAVVKTLCQLPGIKSVKVTVDGQDIKSADGSFLGFLAGDDINIEKDSTENKYAALYFADKTSRKLKKEIRRINITDSQSIEQYILNGLIEGPKSKELESVQSPDTSIISAQTTDGTCFVNFSAAFVSKNSGSKEKEMNAVYSVVNSLTELDSVKNVQFLIDGKKSDSFGSISISGTFYRNESMISE